MKRTIFEQILLISLSLVLIYTLNTFGVLSVYKTEASCKKILFDGGAFCVDSGEMETSPEEPTIPSPEEPTTPSPEEPTTPSPEEPSTPSPEEPSTPPENHVPVEGQRTYNDAIQYLESHSTASQTTVTIGGETVAVTKKTAADGTVYYEASQPGVQNTIIMDKNGNIYSPIRDGEAYYYTDQYGNQHFLSGSGKPSHAIGKTAALAMNGDLLKQIDEAGGSKNYTIKSIDPITGKITLNATDQFGNYVCLNAGSKTSKFKTGDTITLTTAQCTGVFVDNDGNLVTNFTATGDAQNQGLFTGNLFITSPETNSHTFSSRPRIPTENRIILQADKTQVRIGESVILQTEGYNLDPDYLKWKLDDNTVAQGKCRYTGKWGMSKKMKSCAILPGMNFEPQNKFQGFVNKIKDLFKKPTPIKDQYHKLINNQCSDKDVCALCGNQCIKISPSEVRTLRCPRTNIPGASCQCVNDSCQMKYGESSFLYRIKDLLRTKSAFAKLAPKHLVSDHFWIEESMKCEADPDCTIGDNGSFIITKTYVGKDGKVYTVTTKTSGYKDGTWQSYDSAKGTVDWVSSNKFTSGAGFNGKTWSNGEVITIQGAPGLDKSDRVITSTTINSSGLTSSLTYSWSQPGVYKVQTEGRDLNRNVVGSNIVVITVTDSPTTTQGTTTTTRPTPPTTIHPPVPTTIQPPALTCYVTLNSNAPARFLGYPFTLSWTLSDNCTPPSCQANCTYTDSGENACDVCAGEGRTWCGPITESNDEELKPTHSGKYTYTISCDNGLAASTDVKVSPLPWWREIIPQLPGFLRGLFSR